MLAKLARHPKRWLRYMTALSSTDGVLRRGWRLTGLCIKQPRDITTSEGSGGRRSESAKASHAKGGAGDAGLAHELRVPPTNSSRDPPDATPCTNAISVPVPMKVDTDSQGHPSSSSGPCLYERALLSGSADLPTLSFPLKSGASESSQWSAHNPFSAEQGADWANDGETEPNTRRKVLPATPIQGLRLESLQAQDAFTRTYSGTLLDRPVVVKVVEDATYVRHSEAGEVLEPYLSRSSPRYLARTVAAQACRSGRQSSLAREDSARYQYGRGGRRAPEVVDRSDQEVWLVRELCDAGCLQDAVAKGWFRRADGAPNVAVIVQTALEIAAGMSDLHAHDIVHGDLSGRTVKLATSHGAPHGFAAKVTDFGLCRTRCLTTYAQTRPDGATLRSMAPEALLLGSCSKEADVYAFGVLLWEMCSGRRAWAAEFAAHWTAVVNAVAVQRRCLPFSTSPALAALARIGAQCMAFSPEERPSFHDIELWLDESEHEMA